MLTEAQKMGLTANIGSMDYRYPLSSGASQYDFAPTMMVYREGEPVRVTYPAIKMKFHPRTAVVGKHYNNVVSQPDKYIRYGLSELSPVTISVYTHQQCTGTTTAHHGRIIADTYIRRLERHVRRMWPSILWYMSGSIRESIPFEIRDLSAFVQGTERQGYELTFYIQTQHAWDLIPDDGNTGITGFEDATLSGMDIPSYEQGDEYSTKIYSISGYMTR